MNNLAQAFEQPIDSADHQDLANGAWMGGPYVHLRYWLGRRLGRNLFRESHDSVEDAVRQYFIDRGCEKGATLVHEHQIWTMLAELVQHHCEIELGNRLTTNRKKFATLEAVMADPELTSQQLAAIANTTEKQIARMSDVKLIQILWERS